MTAETLPETPETLPHVAYGPVRDPEIMKGIVGGEVRTLGHVAIHDVELVGQSLEDVTSESVDGQSSPREALLKVPPPEGFESLGAIALDDSEVDEPRGISGTLYDLTSEQKAKLDEWELTKEGWFQRKSVIVEHPDGTKHEAETHVLPDDARFSTRIPDEAQRPPMANEKRSMLDRIDAYSSMGTEAKKTKK